MSEKIKASEVLRILQLRSPQYSTRPPLEERTLSENTIGLQSLYEMWPQLNELTLAQVQALAELVARAMIGNQVQMPDLHSPKDIETQEFATVHEALSPVEKYLFAFAKYVRNLDHNVNVYDLYLTRKKQEGQVVGVGFTAQEHEIGFSQFAQGEISSLTQPEWKKLAWSHVNMVSKAINSFRFYWQHHSEKPSSEKKYTAPKPTDLTLEYARIFLQESLVFLQEQPIESWYDVNLRTASGREITRLIPRQHIYLEMLFLDLGDEDLLELIKILEVTNKRAEFTNKYRDLLRVRQKAQATLTV